MSDFSSTSSLAFKIMSSDNDPIVSIESDGTVIVHKEGRQPEAARIFWNFVQQFRPNPDRDRLKEILKQISEKPIDPSVKELVEEVKEILNRAVKK